jgi:eukaryotic-like serine/threonine-protein kinase
MEAIDRNHKTRFGAFEVDLRAGELRKHAIRVKLQAQPFQVLSVLLEHPGDVVTREELRQKLWPGDTFVDFDTGLNSAVKKLREALCDSAEEPRYIETLPRRGYRFVAHVENGSSASVSAAPVPASTASGEPVSIEQPPATAPALATTSGTRSKWRAWMAAGAAVLMLVAAVAWRVYFKRPVLTNTDVILVTNFVNKTGDPIFDGTLDKALEVKLAESPFLSVFPAADVRTSMQMMRRDPSERVTPELGIEICKRQGLKALVAPEIAAFGNTYLITLEAIDARTQKVIARRQEVAENKDKVIAALGKAGSQLRRQLGESLSSLEKYDAPLDLATTSSLEALQAYRTGQTLFRSGKQSEAIPYFERAIELDPEFCSAYSVLGTAYFSVINDEAARKNFAKAYELKDSRLTQEENFQTTALYHSYITGNLEKEITVLVLYQQAYPRSAFAANRLGIAYATIGKKDEALRQFNRAIELSPVPSAQYYSNASQAQMTLDRLDDAKDLLGRWQKVGSLNPFERDVLYRIAFFQNDTDAMARYASQTPPDDMHWRQLQMQFAFLRGDMNQFRSLSEGLVNEDLRAGEKENAANELALRAQLESLLGNYDLAQKLCRHASDPGNFSSSELWRCAEALGEAGDFMAAETLAAKMGGMDPEDTIEQNVKLPLIRSIVERHRGNAIKAQELLAQAEPYEYSLDVYYRRAQADLAAGDSGNAIVEFKRIMLHRGWGWWPVYSPLAQLGIARAYALQGDRQSSRKAYDDFFTTWKAADPDIPILRQAKAEYRKITATASTAALASQKR